MKPINSVTRGYFKPAAFLLVLVLCSSVPVVFYLFPPPKPVPSASNQTRLSWYFESGQWRSDVHTLINMVDYLVRSDPPPLTNQPPLRVEADAGLVLPVPAQS